LDTGPLEVCVSPPPLPGAHPASAAINAAPRASVAILVVLGNFML
jgi:hypothetical protein